MTETLKSMAMPDPVRAHGAWIYLIASVGAGALVGVRRGVEPALLVGTGFAGGFLLVAALSTGGRGKVRQLVVGTGLVLLAPTAALWLGAERAFLAVASLALAPAIGAVTLARTRGSLSTSAIAVGIAALTLAAPAAAMAGGVPPVRAGLLFVLLWSFYAWRSTLVAAPLVAGGAWDREELRARGLREAGLAALWTLAVAVVLRLA